MVEALPFSAAILCGGSARRMGGVKAALIVDGQPLLDRAIERIHPMAAAVILAHGVNPAQRDGCISVADASPGRGPLGGIVAALDASPHPRCAVIAVDMPDFDAPLLQKLSARLKRVDAVVPVDDRGFQPLHAVYARSALQALRATLDSRDVSVHHALSRLRVRYVSASALGARAGFARNLNAPEDVTAWQEDRRPAATRHR
jgi:molybdopterin-guanine dinucleotide biosynthesis protein A